MQPTPDNLAALREVARNVPDELSETRELIERMLRIIEQAPRERGPAATDDAISFGMIRLITRALMRIDARIARLENPDVEIEVIPWL